MRSKDAEHRLDTRNRRVGELLDAICNGLEPKGLANGSVTRIKIKAPSRDDPEALVAVQATDGVGKHIAFVGGLDIIQALLTWRAKEAGGGLRWRPDVPWGERS